MNMKKFKITYKKQGYKYEIIIEAESQKKALEIFSEEQNAKILNIEEYA